MAEALGLGEPPAAADHDDLFTFQLYPYASVYLGAEGMLGGEARDRVAGFWRALGQTPPAEPDHLSVLLALYARLGELEAAAGEPEAAERWRHARKALLWEHLASWLPAYLAKLSRAGVLAVLPPLGRAARRGAGERGGRAGAAGEPAAPPARGAADGRPPRRATPRRSSPPSSPRCAAGSSSSAPTSTAPPASWSWARASASGSSSSAPSSARTPSATLRWLAAEAGRWAGLHRAQPEAFAPVATFWTDRAQAAATLLAELAG